MLKNYTIEYVEKDTQRIISLTTVFTTWEQLVRYCTYIEKNDFIITSITFNEIK